jgi:hypothetical protein
MPDHDNLPVPAAEAPAEHPKLNLSTLLPPTAIDLTPEEVSLVQGQQQATRILGPAAASVLVCAGNQAGVPEDRRCPYSAKCALLRLHKAPQDHLCPFERDLVESRFAAWCTELGHDPGELPESVRAVVADLVWLDIQEQRCLAILAKGEAARLTQINVKEVHPDTGEHLSWERVIHANVDMLDRIHTQRRMIFKDWELTPEMKTRKAKLEGKGKGDDLSSQLASKADKLRRLPVIEG